MTKTLLEQYAEVAGEDVVIHLKQIASHLQGMKVIHVNSTKEGGGVAEILHRFIPLQNELGIDTRWEVISGTMPFFQCTKFMHNALQGSQADLPSGMFMVYEKENEVNAEMLRAQLEEADFVFIHDLQPAALIRFCPNRKGKWIWRCHVDASQPFRPVWKFLRTFVQQYDASLWSLSEFAQVLNHPMYLVAPSIDPLSEKNMLLDAGELAGVCRKWGLDPDRPIITQVSRYDKFKDPLGVIRAYHLVKPYVPIQLVLAGGGATDDPEGAEVLERVKTSAGNDPDIHILLLPADDHRTINALQRISTIVLQKSTKEGFGLTVTEAMWKGKPVIGGDTGGIRLQVVNHHTGFLVTTPEGAALRIRYLLRNKREMEEMGRKAHEFVRENFLITRQLREHLTLMLSVMFEKEDRIEAV